MKVKKRFWLLTILLMLLLPCFAIVATGTQTALTQAVAEGTYTVTYKLDENADAVYAETEVAENGYAQIPVTPEKDGSVFKYWKKDGVKFSFTTRIQEDVVLVAEWEQLLYTVTFKVGDEVASVQTVQKNTTAIAPNNVVCPEGKTFAGWDTDFSSVVSDLTVNALLADATYTVDFYGFDGEWLASQEITHGENTEPLQSIPEIPHYTFAGYEGETENITANGKVYLTYSPEEYEIGFYSDGSSFGEKKATVAYGGVVPFPAVPSKENYIFIGWYKDLDDEQMYSFNTAVEGAFDLYAKFIPIEKPKYSVTFYAYDGSQYGGTQYVEEGASAIVPGDPYRAGYDFIGWSQDFSNITENTEVYPIFGVKEYTVTIQDCEGVLKTLSVKYGANVQEPDASEVREKEGYEFIGWDESFKNIQGDTTITAKYRAKTFVVMFYNGVKKVGVTQYITYGESANAPKLAEKEGYEFLGWADDTEEISEGYKNVTQDGIYFAVYEKKAYTVTFIDGGETVYNATALYGETVALYMPEKEDYIFIGWFTDEACTAHYDFSAPVKGELTLYAKWEEKPETTYTVTFYVDGKVYGTQTVAENANAILPSAPVKEGYTFTGWSCSTENVSGDLEVQAQFEINTYTVTFVYADKTATFEITYLQGATAPTDTAREGYTFDGWDKDFDVVKSDMTITAVYKINRYTVTFYNGTSIIATQTVEYNGYPSLIASPVQAGYVFEGWLDENGDTFSFSNAITGDSNVYAKYRALTYNIYYYINGTLHETQTYEVGATVTPLPEPTYDDPLIVFSGWSEIPEKMPGSSVVVTATTVRLQYYTVYYYVDGALYYEQEVLMGSPVTMIDEPTSADDRYAFSGWQGMPVGFPESMPERDVKIYGYFNKVVLDNNLFYLDIEYDGGDFATAYIQVTDNVELAGFIARLTYAGDYSRMTVIWHDDIASDAFDDGDGWNMIWSQGSNLTQTKAFFEVHFELAEGEIFDVSQLAFEIEQIYAIDADGGLYVPEYLVEIEGK